MLCEPVVQDRTQIPEWGRSLRPGKSVPKHSILLDMPGMLPLTGVGARHGWEYIGQQPIQNSPRPTPTVPGKLSEVSFKVLSHSLRRSPVKKVLSTAAFSGTLVAGSGWDGSDGTYFQSRRPGTETTPLGRNCEVSSAGPPGNPHFSAWPGYGKPSLLSRRLG